MVGREFGGRLTQPTPGTAGMLCYHCRKPPTVKALLHPEKMISLLKMESTAAAEALRWEYNCSQTAARRVADGDGALGAWAAVPRPRGTAPEVQASVA